MNIPAFSKTYAGRRVLDFPGMSVEPGKIYAVIGANGSGKTTFAAVLAGALPSDGGKLPPVCGSIGYMPQKSFAFRMSVRKNLMLCGKDETRAGALLCALGLSELADKRADRLSGGETARLSLARILMRGFELVILDEPCAAMDIETTKGAEDEIAAYVRETGCALFIITHSLSQAKRLADSILYFHKGRLLEHGAKEKLLGSPESPELRAFLDFYGV